MQLRGHLLAAAHPLCALARQPAPSSCARDDNRAQPGQYEREHTADRSLRAEAMRWRGCERQQAIVETIAGVDVEHDAKPAAPFGCRCLLVEGYESVNDGRLNELRD